MDQAVLSQVATGSPCDMPVLAGGPKGWRRGGGLTAVQCCSAGVVPCCQVVPCLHVGQPSRCKHKAGARCRQASHMELAVRQPSAGEDSQQQQQQPGPGSKQGVGVTRLGASVSPCGTRSEDGPGTGGCCVCAGHSLAGSCCPTGDVCRELGVVRLGVGVHSQLSPGVCV